MACLDPVLNCPIWQVFLKHFLLIDNQWQKPLLSIADAREIYVMIYCQMIMTI